MPVTSYTHNILKKISNEFDGCITESEKNLMQSFKRVVIRGKRRSGVPVLFTQEMAKNQTNLVDKNNIYLFPNPKSSKSISDPQVIYKHIRFAGIKNPDALTSTKLSKHLATMSHNIKL